MLKNLKFILNENVILFDEEGNIFPGRASTFGYKFTIGSEQYGSYMIVKKPTVTPQDIMDCLEALCPEIEQLLNEFTADVVPKSEVFLASSDAVKMLIDCHGYALTHDADIKEEVAREIFEEIDNLFDKYPTLRNIGGTAIAELKKKYTEDPDDIT